MPTSYTKTEDMIKLQLIMVKCFHLKIFTVLDEMKDHLNPNLSHLTWLAHAYLHNVCCALYILESD